VAGSNREKELVGLMERADQGTGGPVVNAMVYSADLRQIRADVQELNATMREKGCDSLVPATKLAPAAKVAPAPKGPPKP
jgi:hypothetical protein